MPNPESSGWLTPASPDEVATPHQAPTELERVFGWLDERTGLANPLRLTLRKVFPDNASFLLGEVALFCFVILLATGTFLTFFFVADAREVEYRGPYQALDGSTTSAAFASVMRLSFEVKAGLLMRQTHHWAALLFVAAIAIHLARIFFTAAFRKPRELNWIIGSSLLLLALAEGFTGYSLPDDLLSGTGLRIFASALLSIPFIGPWVASLFIGGEFPNPDLISRLFVIHVVFVPTLLVAGITVHVALVFLQKHTQYKGGLAREDNVVGLPFWPGQAFRSTGLLFLTAAVVVLIGGLVQINPIWIYGPFNPSSVSAPAQPDWYIGWLEGALRIALPFEPVIFGVTIPEPFVPGVVLPGLIVTALVLWPFIEARLTHDHREHHLLDWWWENPYRTATGAAFVALFLLATLAGGNDVLAVLFNVPVESLTLLFQLTIFTVPVATWIVTFLIARQWRDSVAKRPRQPEAGVRLVRTSSGGFEEIEEQ